MGVLCSDCGYVGDAFESTFFKYENNKPPYVLQCNKCGSKNVKEVGRQVKNDVQPM